jgi:hypothetical protein
MVPAHFFDLKSLNYDVITIEFVNYFPTKFNGNILFELLPLHHLLGHSEQLQVMDKNTMVMFGASCKPVRSKMCLDWASE